MALTMQTSAAIAADIIEIPDIDSQSYRYYFDRAQTNDESLNDAKSEKSNVLELDNVVPFTPTEDYHPLTKKYFDDNAGGGGAVDSVNGEVGVVVLDKTDIGLPSVDDTSDLDKPISTLNQTALDGKEPAKGVDDNYVTDAELVVIGNTSGTNTGDKTDPEIKTAYENNADTNAYTDTEKTKLAGVAEGATNFDPADAGDIVAESLSVTGTDGLNGLINVGDNTSQGAVGNLALIPINGVWNKVEGGVASPIGSGGTVDAYTKTETDDLLDLKLNVAAIDDAATSGADKIWSIDQTKAYIDENMGWPILDILVPSVDGTWVTATPYTLASGEASARTGSLSSVEWKLEEGGTYAAATGTATWSVLSMPIVEGLNTFYVQATDDSARVSTRPRTIRLDSIAPVVVADADSTHDGSTPVVGGMTLTEVNPGTMTASVVGATPTTTPLTGTYPDYVTGPLTPDGVGDITVTFDGVEDLAGNVATTTGLVQLFSGPATYIFEENFEGIGYENSWDIVTGVPDPDYTPPLRGTYSLHVGPAAQEISIDLPSAYPEWWVAFRIHFIAHPGSASVMLALHDATDAQLTGLKVATDGSFGIPIGGGSTTYGSTTSTLTDYYVWIHNIKGTGGNGEIEMYVNTTRVKPGIADAFTDSSSFTTDATQLKIFSDWNAEYIIDQIPFDTSEIGDLDE